MDYPIPTTPTPTGPTLTTTPIVIPTPTPTPDHHKGSVADEMYALACRVRDTLVEEARFDAWAWALGDPIPESIRDGLPADFNKQVTAELEFQDGDCPRCKGSYGPLVECQVCEYEHYSDSMEEEVRVAYDTWFELENESVLDVRASVAISEGSFELKTLTLVLTTGGPHVELTITSNEGAGYVTAYTWYGAGKSTAPGMFGGHPIAELWGYYRDQLAEVSI